jgi:ATP-dependent DNA helicase PIF1
MSFTPLFPRITLWLLDMTCRNCHEAVDRSSQYIMPDVHPALDRLPFGGKVILCGGDWRQILPVVPRASPADVVKASLPPSHLHENMRIARLDGRDRSEAQGFASWLKALGVGALPLQNIAGVVTG